MKRRMCHLIIIKMLAEIPNDKIEFINDLRWNYNDSLYKAPEEIIQWTRTQETLVKHIPKPIEEWEFKILSIFTCRSIDAIKALMI
jgi:hypothetical protein